MVKIGNIELKNFPLLLAPMEDVSDPPFRALCKEKGADLVYTEFISSEGLIRDASKSIKKLDSIIFAYEPVWSIGTGIIPKRLELSANINNIKKILSKLKKSIKPKILYGGSVNPKNVKELAQIKEINGFLVGGASLSAKKFIDIIQKSTN